jgi:hypothetical protein
MPKSPDDFEPLKENIPVVIQRAASQLLEELSFFPQFVVSTPEYISGIHFLPVEVPSINSNELNELIKLLQDQFDDVEFDYSPEHSCILITPTDEDTGVQAEKVTGILKEEIADLLHEHGYQPLTLGTESGDGTIFILKDVDLKLDLADTIKKLEKKYSNIEIRVVIDEHASTITVIPKIDSE